MYYIYILYIYYIHHDVHAEIKAWPRLGKFYIDTSSPLRGRSPRAGGTH